MILLDTNVLTRITRSTQPQSAVARAAIDRLSAAGEQLVIVPQNVYEFWAVATRKPGAPPTGQNGLGMSVTQAAQWLRFFRRRFLLMPDRDTLPNVWQALVEAHAITGFRSHDVRFVAAMQTYGITRLLTFNLADFRPFAVTLIDPASV